MEPMTVERSGAQFEGYKFSGKKMLDEMGDSQGSVGLLWASELEEFGISKQEIAEFLKLIETKNIVALVGEVHGYVVLFLGSSEDDFV